MATVGYNLSLPESWFSVSHSPFTSITVSSTISDVCQHKDCSLLRNYVIYFLLPVWVCCEAQVFCKWSLVSWGFNFGLGVYFMACLWQPAMTPISLWTLWDPDCIQVVMGYIKRKWIHMWGLALVLACGTVELKSREGLTWNRRPLVVKVHIYTHNWVELWSGEFALLKGGKNADTYNSLLLTCHLKKDIFLSPLKSI